MVYAIDAPDIERTKFGITSDIRRRFAGLASQSPAPLVLLGHVWMPEAAEQHIFEFLKDDRCHGEWFRRTEQVRSVAALIAAGRDVQLAEVIGLDRMIVRDRASIE